MKKHIITILILLIYNVQAFAYVGPGAGLGFVGSLFAVIATLVLALLGLVILPLRIILKKRKTAKENKTTD